MTLKLQHIGCIALLSLGLYSCKKENRWDLLKGTGEVIKEERTIPPVRYFNIGKGKINCYFTYDSIFKVEVEAGKKLIGLIKTELNGDTLFMTDENKCNFVRSYKHEINIYISSPDVKTITQYGVGLVKSTNTLVGTSLDIESWGAGDFYLDVQCNYLRTHTHKSTAVYITGTATTHNTELWHNSTLFGDDLKTQTTYVYDNTTGNIYCEADSQLTASIRLSGNIIYSGNPHVDVIDLGGTGTITKK